MIDIGGAILNNDAPGNVTLNEVEYYNYFRDVNYKGRAIAVENTPTPLLWGPVEARVVCAFWLR